MNILTNTEADRLFDLRVLGVSLYKVHMIVNENKSTIMILGNVNAKLKGFRASKEF